MAEPSMDLAAVEGEAHGEAGGHVRRRGGGPRWRGRGRTASSGEAVRMCVGRNDRMGAEVLGQPKWGLVGGFGFPHKFVVRSRAPAGVGFLA